MSTLDATSPSGSRGDEQNTDKHSKTDTTAKPGAESSFDGIFHILSNKRRRYTLHYLMQTQDGTASKREISRRIAAWENGIPLKEVTPDMRKRVYIALHQSHLPKMEESGLLESEAEGSDVSLAEDKGDLQVYVDIVQGEELPWSHFYLGLGFLSCSLVVLSGIGVPPYATVPPIALTAGVAGVFTLVSLVHTLKDREDQLGTDGPPPELRENKTADWTDAIGLGRVRSWWTDYELPTLNR